MSLERSGNGKNLSDLCRRSVDRHAREVAHQLSEVSTEVDSLIHAGQPYCWFTGVPVEKTLRCDRFCRRHLCCRLGEIGQGAAQIGVIGGENLNGGDLNIGKPQGCSGLVLQGHPLHGLTCRAVVGLGSEQRVVVGFEIAVVEHRGFDDGELAPGVGKQQIVGFNFIQNTDEVDVCTVFTFNFIEQVNAWVVWEETVFTVVELKMHST